MRFVLLVMLSCCVLTAFGQAIRRVEYFIDADPGYGKGKPVSVGANGQVAFRADLQGYAAGIHTLFVRAQDENGWWSTTYNQPFLVDFINPASNVIAAEYFYDSDPGYGSGIAIAFPPGLTPQIPFTADLSSLDPGLHTLYARVKDQDGRWSTTYSKPFLVDKIGNNAPASIIAAEYFFDEDKGYGSGLPIPITPGSLLEVPFVADLSMLSTGIHTLFVRTKDSAGRWSTTFNTRFLVEDIDIGTLSNIVAVEYFLNTDPGYGKGTPIPISPAPEQNLNFTADISKLDFGKHVIYVRAQDAQGRWSTVYISSFTIGESPVITKVIPNVGSPGSSITINGLSFNPVAAQNIVKFDSLVAQVTNASSDALVVTVPEGYLGYTTLTVTVNKLTATAPQRFLIVANAPVITAVEPASGAAGDVVTITGEHFSSQEKEIRVWIGGQGAEVVEASEGRIQIKVPEKVSGEVTLSVSVRGITTEAPTNFTVLAPRNNVPPQIIHRPIVLSCVNVNVPVVADAVDQTNNVQSVLLYYRRKGTEQYQKTGMQRKAGDTYQSFIPASIVTSAGIEYYLEAFDDYKARHATPVYEIILQDKPVLTQPVTNMLPANGTTDVTVPVRFSWAGSPEALTYDVYLWPSSQAKPAEPTATGLTEFNYIYAGTDVQFGAQYSWQVIARDACTGVEGPVQQITFRPLPDLTVVSVKAPGAAFSEETIQLEWEVSNTGQGATEDKDWYDGIYLSARPLFDPAEAEYLKGMPNVSALAAGKGYTQTTTVTLPRGITGDYYFYVEADRGRRIQETDETNNLLVQTTPIKVTLKPPPDLEVDSVVAPRNSFSGQTIAVRWKVQNTGPGQTEVAAWQDMIYLSTQEELDTRNAYLLKSVPHQGALAPGESYRRNELVTLPRDIQGRYYLFVQTNPNRTVYESTINNVRRSDSLSVILLPFPDLVITEVKARDTVSCNESVAISWQGQNEGATVIENALWSDRVFLSSSEDGTQNVTWLGGGQFNERLDLNQSYQGQAALTIPRNITGDYYLFVKTDANDGVYEYSDENNNVTRSAKTIHIAAPDLTVKDLVVPQTASSGQLISVQWTVSNAGKGALINRSRRDVVYLSATPTLTEDAYELGVANVQNSLVPGSGAERSLQAVLPQGMQGSYYAVVVTDESDQIFEDGREANNVAVSARPLTITLANWADLQVNAFTLPKAAFAGDTLELNFTVSNPGKADASGTLWQDKIYISLDSVWNPNQAKYLTSITRSQGLAANASYDVQTDLILPMLSLLWTELKRANCYIYIQTDAQNDLYEHTDETNNITRSPAIFVTCPGPVNLRMDWVKADKVTLKSGEQMSASWRVTNIGSRTDFWDYNLWYDGIYLSKDTLWDGQDLFVTDQVIQGPLMEGASYQASLSFRLPNGIAGEYFVLIVADHKDKNDEANFKNNYQYLKVINQQGQPLPQVPYKFVLTASPDLVIDSFSAPVTGIAGQPLRIAWTISNQGDTVTTQAAWTEKVYLSTNYTIDGNDLPIGTRIQQRSLAVGGSYRDTLAVFLPPDAEGNYVLIFKTDDRTAIYEHEGEGNNVAAAQLLVTRADPADLVVTDIQAPDTMVAGEPVTIDWTLLNQGEHLAGGYTGEGVFLSADSLLDAEDIRLGTDERPIRLAPQGTVKRSLTAFVDNLALGSYYLLVEADLKNNIYETEEGNNTAVAAYRVTVTVPVLPLGTTVTTSLPDDRRKYYRLSVPDSLAGETLLVSLKGEEQAVNTLYLRHGNVPSPVTYDFKFNLPASADQEIVVPELKAGDYYVLITGQFPGESPQTISLSTRLIPFEVRVVDANQGGNSGMVTVKIEGAKFTKGMTITLTAATLGTITAARYELKSSLLLYATFNLRGAAEGQYDVRLTKTDGSAAALPEGFKVVQGMVKGLTIQTSAEGGGNGQGGSSATKGFVCCDRELDFTGVTKIGDYLPPNTRINRIVSMTFYVENQGNVDIPIPERYLISLDGAPLGLSVNELGENKQDAFLLFRETDGPEHVLRPGAKSAITLYTKAVTRLRFKMIE